MILVLRLTLLAPEILEGLLKARQSHEVTLALGPLQMDWAGQRSQLAARSTSKAQV